VEVAAELAAVPGDTYERVELQLRGDVLRGVADMDDPMAASRKWVVG
jgi:hypothetical protein